MTSPPGSISATGASFGCQRLCPRAAPSWTDTERSIAMRSAAIAAARYSPYDRPITSSITSSVPAPMRFKRMSRQARSMPYSFM